jgi:hypothetical protein
MAVQSPESVNEYIGNGATTYFAVGFQYLKNSELVVTVALVGESAAPQIEGVHYTLSGEPDPTTSVVFADPPASDAAITIYRQVPYTQLTSFRNQGSFAAPVHEAAMDEIVFQTQQLDRRLDAIEGGAGAGTVLAGAGLAYGLDGVTLNVGAGTGIQVNADTIETLYGGVADMAEVSAAAASGGVLSGAARIDHSHRVTLGGVVEISDSTSNAGASDDLPRSDHIHAHGNRGGGTLHAAATTSVAGFMSSADKTKLDTLGLDPSTYTGTYRTVGFDVGGTLTNDSELFALVAGVDFAFTSTLVFEVILVGSGVFGAFAEPHYSMGAVYSVQDSGGTVSQLGSTTVLWEHGGAVASHIYAVFSDSGIAFLPNGLGSTIDWRLTIRWRTIPQP